MARCPAGHESQTSDYCDTCGAVMGGAPVTPASPLEAAALLGADPAAPSPSPGPDPGDPCPVCGAGRGGRFCEECGFDYELAELLPSVPAPGTAQPVAGPELNGQAAPDGEPTAEATGVPAVEPISEPIAAPISEPGNVPPSAQPAPGAPQSPDGLESSDAAHEESRSGVAQAPLSAPPDASPGRALTVVVTADREYYAAQVERGDIVESEFPFPKYPGERRFTLDADVLRIGRASASRGIAVEIDLTGPPLDPAVSHLHAQLLRGADGGWRLVDLGSANGTRLNGAELPVPVESEIPVTAGDRIHVGVWTTLVLEEAEN